MAETDRNPYSALPETAFWRSAVAAKDALAINRLWDPKFEIQLNQKVVTFGSCFAQHIGRALRARGFHWYITEHAPPGMSQANQALFNYNLFSCRTGNIYTASLLKQWVEWALGERSPPEEYWLMNGRYFDPFRPAIEPEGFASLKEMLASRDYAIAAFRRSIAAARYFVFTLGLTESWFNAEKGYEYPMCPGTTAGAFDPERHVFKNQSFEYIRTHLLDALVKLRKFNNKLKVILTVSPVPLTATNSGRHVLMATMESKSILRSVAGQLRIGHWWIDYFPSYEIISSPVFGGRFFEANLRNVNKAGVDFVMDSFFADLEAKFGAPKAAESVLATLKSQLLSPLDLFRRREGEEPPSDDDPSEDVVCEEQLLEAFGKRR
jgi:hypothetical protein